MVNWRVMKRRRRTLIWHTTPFLSSSYWFPGRESWHTGGEMLLQNMIFMFHNSYYEHVMITWSVVGMLTREHCNRAWSALSWYRPELLVTKYQVKSQILAGARDYWPHWLLPPAQTPLTPTTGDTEKHCRVGSDSQYLDNMRRQWDVEQSHIYKSPLN